MRLLALADSGGLAPGLGGLAATGLVLLALVGAAWLIRRGTIALPRRRSNPFGLNVETAFPLGERRSLAVVSVEGRRLLLGLTPAHVSLITELGDKEPFGARVDRRVSGGESA